MEETDQEELVSKLAGAARVAMCAPTLFETELVMVRKLKEEGRRITGGFLEAFGVEVMWFGDHHRRAAIEAFSRYGKGRHPAGLNYGDCMSYAAAKVAMWPLLYVGDDFARTDIEAA